VTYSSDVHHCAVPYRGLDNGSITSSPVTVEMGNHLWVYCFSI